MKKSIVFLLALFVLIATSKAYVCSSTLTSKKGTVSKSYSVNKAQDIYLNSIAYGYLEYGIMGWVKLYIYAKDNAVIKYYRFYGKVSNGKYKTEKVHFYQKNYSAKFYKMTLMAIAESATVDGKEYIASAKVTAKW